MTNRSLGLPSRGPLDPPGAVRPGARTRRTAVVACATALALASALVVRVGGSQPQPAATGPKAPVIAPVKKLPPTCAVTGVSPSSGPPGTPVAVTGSNLANCTVAIRCGASIRPGCLQTQSGCTLTAPNLPTLPTTCQVIAYPVNADPSPQLTGKDFTVTAAQANDCHATSVTPTSTKAGSLITIGGTRMDQGCLVSFQGQFAAGSVPVRSASSGSLQAQVPAWHPGLGALRVAPQARPNALTELWFQILPQVVGSECEAYEVSPAVAKPGDKVYVYGTAMDRQCSVSFLDARSFGYPAASQTQVDSYRLLVEVPYMPPGAAKAYSNKVGPHGKLGAAPFQVAEYAPRLVSVVPNQASSGTVVQLTGDGFVYPEQSIRVRLEYYPGRTIDVVPNVSSAQKMTFVVPDIYNNITPNEEAAHPVSKLWAYRRDPAFSSNALDFRFQRKTSCAAVVTTATRPGYKVVGSLQCKPPQGQAYLRLPSVGSSSLAVCCGETYGTADAKSLCAPKPAGAPCDARQHWPKSFTPTCSSGTLFLDFPAGCYAPDAK
jgi:hypothetical protein